MQSEGGPSLERVMPERRAKQMGMMVHNLLIL